MARLICNTAVILFTLAIAVNAMAIERRIYLESLFEKSSSSPDKGSND